MTVDLPDSMSNGVLATKEQCDPIPECPRKPAIARSPVLRLRGLPFLATSLDVKDFFSDFELSDVYICRRNGEAVGGLSQVELRNLCLAAYDATTRLHQVTCSLVGPMERLAWPARHCSRQLFRRSSLSATASSA
jgi:hypothetical protein